MRVAAPGSAALDFFTGPAGQIAKLATPLIEMIATGILERHPGLKLVMAESGAGWIPWLIQDLDTRYEQLAECSDHWRATGDFSLNVRPSEIFRRQVFVSFLNDGVALSLLEFFGPDNLLWASDYPHPDSTWPHSTAAVDRHMSRLPAETRRKLVHDNAAALYGIEQEDDAFAT